MLSALILTAGLGTRLDPITRLVAKAAVPLGSSTLIEHVLAWLRDAGIRDVVLNLHHRPASIAAVVGDGSHLGVTARYSWEQPLLGSAGGPRHALPLIDSDPFVIVNGDTLTDLDLKLVLDAHRARGAEVTMALIPNPAPDHYNGVLLDEEDRVVGFVPKGRAQGSWHLIGVQVVAASVFATLPDNVPAESVAGLYRDFLRDRPGAIRGYRTNARFLDIGTPRDYLDTVRALDVFSHPTTSATTRVVDSVVWPGATIAENVDLEYCVVVTGAHVPAGLRVRDAVLTPSSLAGPGDTGVRIEGDLAIWSF